MYRVYRNALLVRKFWAPWTHKPRNVLLRTPLSGSQKVLRRPVGGFPCTEAQKRSPIFAKFDLSKPSRCARQPAHVPAPLPVYNPHVACLFSSGGEPLIWIAPSISSADLHRFTWLRPSHQPHSMYDVSMAPGISCSTRLSEDAIGGKDLLKDAPPAKRFWTSLRLACFPRPLGVVALLFSCAEIPEALLEGSRDFF